MILREANPGDGPALQAIREAAFAPIFASFRGIVGDEVAAVAFAAAETEQARHLDDLLPDGSPWTVLAAVEADDALGFAAFAVTASGLGELGLNAVHPSHQRRGVAGRLHAEALARMKAAGARAAAVGVGGDPSHAPARRAYERAGFGTPLPSLWLYRRL